MGPDPQNTFWANDQTRFGLKMLQKMGWTEGKGLGKYEQGQTTHVKLTTPVEREGTYIPSHHKFSEVSVPRS